MAAKGIKPVQPLPPIIRTTEPIIAVPGIVWIALAVLLGSMMLAWVAFMLVPGIRVGGNEFSNDRAIFLALNCGTLTGFNTSIGISDFNPESILGPLICLVVTVIGVLASLIMGGLAAVRALRLPYRDGQVISAAVAATALAGIGGAVVIGIGLTPGPFGAMDAVFQGVCAFGNCGLVLGRLSEFVGWRLHVVLLPLAVVGGLGLPVLMEVYDWATKGRLISRHSKTTLLAVPVFYLIGIVGVLIFVWPAGAVSFQWNEARHSSHLVIQYASIRAALANASALSLDTRTLGFPVSTDSLSRAGQMWLVILMAIGAGSAGTAGGLKATNLIVMGRGIRQSLSGGIAGKVFGIACTWFGCYATMAGLCWLALLQLEPQIPAERLAFLSVSASSNVGLSTETLTIVGPGLYVLSATMLLGRLVPIAMLWWIARRAVGAELLAA